MYRRANRVLPAPDLTIPAVGRFAARYKTGPKDTHRELIPRMGRHLLVGSRYAPTGYGLGGTGLQRAKVVATVPLWIDRAPGRVKATDRLRQIV